MILKHRRYVDDPDPGIRGLEILPFGEPYDLVAAIHTTGGPSDDIRLATMALVAPGVRPGRLWFYITAEGRLLGDQRYIVVPANYFAAPDSVTAAFDAGCDWKMTVDWLLETYPERLGSWLPALLAQVTSEEGP
jgi:hypothetical protein